MSTLYHMAIYLMYYQYCNCCHSKYHNNITHIVSLPSSNCLYQSSLSFLVSSCISQCLMTSNLHCVQLLSWDQLSNHWVSNVHCLLNIVARIRCTWPRWTNHTHVKLVRLALKTPTALRRIHAVGRCTFQSFAFSECQVQRDRGGG